MESQADVWPWETVIAAGATLTLEGSDDKVLAGRSRIDWVSVASRIALVALTDAEYAAFAEHQVAESARQRVQAGECMPGEALALCREEQSDLLADRLRGQGHVFLKAVDAASTLVGWLWVGPAPGFLDRYGVSAPARMRWLNQITVVEDLRGRGYGGAILEALHQQLATEGVEALYLRVYDWNAAARRLYAHCGYEVVHQFSTDAHLRKRFSTASV